MAHPLPLLALATVTASIASVALPETASACSLALGPDPASSPEPDETLHARPVFFVPVDTEPTLRRVGGAESELELELAEDFASTFTGFTLTRAWRPTEPLAAGSYRIDGVATAGGGVIDFEFFVDPQLPTEAPALEGVTLAVRIDEPDEGGCGAMSSCDGVDFTKLELRVPETSPVTALRVEVRNPKTNLRRIELVDVPDFAQNGQRPVIIWNNPSRWPGSFKSARLCVTAQPLIDSGAIGPTLDLGCFDPDGEDPRVIDERGCSTGHSNGPLMVVWLGLLVALRSVRSRRALA